MASSLADDAVPPWATSGGRPRSCSIPCALVLVYARGCLGREAAAQVARQQDAGMPTTYKLSAFPVPPCESDGGHDPLVEQTEGTKDWSKRPVGWPVAAITAGGGAGSSSYTTSAASGPAQRQHGCGIASLSNGGHEAVVRAGNGAGPGDIASRGAGRPDARQVGNGEPAQNGHRAGPTTTRHRSQRDAQPLRRHPPSGLGAGCCVAVRTASSTVTSPVEARSTAASVPELPERTTSTVEFA